MMLAAGDPMLAVAAEGISGRRSPDVSGDPIDRFAPEKTADFSETFGIPETFAPPEGHTWQIARQLALSGDYEKAAALYASAYGQDPNPMLYRQYLEVLLKLERYKEAEALALRQMRYVAKGDGTGVPQTLARYRVDLGQIHLAQGQAAKAQKAFSQAVDDYWAQGGVGLAVDELSEALWRQSGTARYSAALYEVGRRTQPAVSTAGCVPFAYELFKAYLHLGQMERMLEEALLFVRTQREGCGGRFTPTTIATTTPTATAESRYEAAMTQIEADWQAYFHQADRPTDPDRQSLPAASSVPSVAPGYRPSGRTAADMPMKVAAGRPMMPPPEQPSARVSQSPMFRLKKALHAYWQKDPQNRDVAEWLWWAALQEGDYGQAFRMAEVFRNFAYDGGLKYLETARIAIRNQTDREAAAALETLLRQAAGQSQDYLSEVVREARRELLDLQFRRLEQGGLADSLELHRLKADYEALWRQNPQAAADPGLWPVARNLARIYAYYTHEEEAARILMEQCIA
ncbi:MAG: tetratricopeptide repeat protein, partial [Bacteroidales bacterium]|nr:tetratricopeptide repeat protein [Bacteroidales bacterium]